MGLKGIIDFCIRRPIAVTMLFMLTILFGIISLFNLKLDLYPDITSPILFVSTEYKGASPEEIETIVTKPLEEALTSVPNVKEVSSTSSPEQSVIVLEVNYGTDMDFTALTVRERIDLVKGYFPDDVENPTVFKFDPSMMPIMFMSVSSGRSLADTTEFLDDQVTPRLERIPGIASVDIYGGLEREIRVEVSRDRLAAYNLPITMVERALQSENVNMPGGVSKKGETEFLIRTLGQFRKVEELVHLPITLPTGGTIPLSEVAHVKDDYQEQIHYSRLDDHPSVMLSIRKESDANTVQVTQRLRKELQKIGSEYGDLFKPNIIFDQAKEIENSLSGVRDNAIFGALLAVLILWFFLRNLRTTSIIGVAIPISIVVTFAILYFSDMTLNIVSMGGLALGVGMLVDNSIVVLENIYRHRQEGKSRAIAAKEGASEVAMAIVASTLTTVVVFLPIVFVQGLTAQIFREMALTVCFSLLASLIVSLTLVPMLSSKFMKLSAKDKEFAAQVRDNEESYHLGRVEGVYRSLLNFAIHHKLIIVLVACVVFALGFLPFLFGIKMEFMATAKSDEYMIDIKLPTGTVLEKTDSIASQIETFLERFPEIESVSTRIGSEGSGWMTGRTTEAANIRVNLLDNKKDRTPGIMEDTRKFVSTITGAEILVTESKARGGGGFGSSPISIEISGPDLDLLGDFSNQAVSIIKGIEGTREVRSSLKEGRPELQLIIDREKANLYGLSAGEIASVVRTAYQGSVPTRLRLGGNEYDIRVQFTEADRLQVTELSSLMIQSAKGYTVPLTEVVKTFPTKGPSEITRKNQTRIVTITGQLHQRDIGSVNKEIEEALKKQIILPAQYSINMGGEAEEMWESFGSLILALILAVIFVYMVMAIQYESLLHPFTIMLSLPLTVFGVTWSLWLTGRALNVSGFIGIIMLAGIVVNNAIVLVDYIETLRGRGLSRQEAILKAGPTRLRPVLMTTLTTVLAMIPMAIGFGEGGELQAPLATVVIGGLTFSTLLTLIAIPVMYLLIDDFGNWLRLVIKGKEASAEYTYHR
jgi:HAE1 family hydrophobic/amphiphilic exporter-1